MRRRPSVTRVAVGMLIAVLVTLPACDRKENTSGGHSTNLMPDSRETGAGVNSLPLADRVKEILRSDPNVSAFAIDVDTSGNLVVLRGTVQTSQQREWAGRLAENAPGVSAVKNELVATEAPAGKTDAGK